MSITIAMKSRADRKADNPALMKNAKGLANSQQKGAKKLIATDDVSNKTHRRVIFAGKGVKKITPGPKWEKLEVNRTGPHPLTCVNKEKVLDIAKKAPDRKSSTLAKMAAYFQQFTLNEEEKAYLLFCWESENIAYNMKGYLSSALGDNSPEGVFQAGMSVCQGFGELYKYFADAIGLKTVCISGYAKGYGYIPGVAEKKTNHLWIGAQLKGYWYLIDSTWGSGGSNMKDEWEKCLNDFYFCCPPEQLIKTHFPEDIKWQLLEKPITKAAFDIALRERAEFFMNGGSSISPNTAVIHTAGKFQVTLTFKTDTLPRILFEMKQGEKKFPNSSTHRCEGNKIFIEAECKTNGTYSFCIYATLSSGISYPQVAEYKVICKLQSKTAISSPTQASKGGKITLEKEEAKSNKHKPVGKTEKNKKEELSKLIVQKGKTSPDPALRVRAESSPDFEKPQPKAKKCEFLHYPQEESLKPTSKNMLHLEFQVINKSIMPNITFKLLNDIDYEVKNSLLIQNNNDKMIVDVSIPEVGTYTLRATKKPTGNEEQYVIKELKITSKVKKAGPVFPVKYDAINSLLMEPLNKHLLQGQTVKFKIKSFDVNKADLITTDGKVVCELKKDSKGVFACEEKVPETRELFILGKDKISGESKKMVRYEVLPKR